MDETFPAGDVSEAQTGDDDRAPAARAGLPPGLALLVRDARTATLATVRPDGRPRLVPVCFVVSAGPIGRRSVVDSPLDLKPKRVVDPRDLARVRDILARPAVELLVQRWDEDWRRLAWVRLDAVASLLEPRSSRDEHAAAVAALREKYPQYLDHDLEARPIIRAAIERVSWWAGSAR